MNLISTVIADFQAHEGMKVHLQTVHLSTQKTGRKKIQNKIIVLYKHN